MRNIQTLIIVFLLGSVAFAQDNTSSKYLNTDLDFETRAKDLVSRMTLDEKISQLGNESDAIPHLGIAKYNWWNECLHGVAGAGVATVFPQAIGMAASFDPDLMYKVATAISTEARAKHHEFVRNNDFGRLKGLTFWSPNINVFRDPRWGRGQETYGEDPYLTGQMGMPFVRGLQGDDPKYFKVVSTAKHYAVHSGPEAERHTFNSVANARDLWETYLPAFYDLMVTAKAYSIMGAYNRVDGESASASSFLLEEILRNKWGFEGFVVSDCGAIADIHRNHKIVNTPPEASAIGIRKGCDLDCGSEYRKHLKTAVEQGLIDIGEIDLSVYRLMLGRMKLGMFDPSEMVPYAQIPIEMNDCDDHKRVANEMAQKSITLLKNNGILPLDLKKYKNIAVVGPNAKSNNVLLGNYNGLPSNPVSVLQGIQKACGNKAKVTYSQACPMVTENAIGGIFQVIGSDYLSTLDDQKNIVAGLRGEYFLGAEFIGKPIFVRIDNEINHNWGNEGPTDTEVAQGILTQDNKVPDNYFSVIWKGTLTAPESGLFKIGLVSNDFGKLYINNQLIVEGGAEWNPKPNVVDMQLEKGEKYEVRIEYVEKKNEAAIYFIWETPSGRENKKTGAAFAVNPKVLEQVKKADVVIFVGGLDASWEGEELSHRVGIDGFFKGDRTSIELPAIQLQTLRELQATGTPVVMVLMSGSAVAFDGLENDLPAILTAWYPGQSGGDAVADVLFGKYNPAGRLPVTFYKSTKDLGDFRDYNMRNGNGLTYRYFNGDVLYPFGHGLSYTKFDYSKMTINQTKICNKDSIIVTVNVKNIGNFDGDEVVQIYVKDVQSDKRMPSKQLREFKRIALKKGEEKTISFTLNAEEDMRYYDPFYKRYMVESGDFEIQIGASSQDIRVKQIVKVE